LRALATTAVLLCACGGLDNRPLMTGSVSGIAAACDPDAVVGIVGDASVRVAPDATCRFRIEGLQPGALQLYVAPTARKVALVGVEVEATKQADVGAVEGLQGAFARVRVSAPGKSDYQGEVTAPDLPITATALGRSGNARIGPFPEGCFRIEVTLYDLGKKSTTNCLQEGDEADVVIPY
jgi:hypothetical protein